MTVIRQGRLSKTRPHLSPTFSTCGQLTELTGTTYRADGNFMRFGAAKTGRAMSLSATASMQLREQYRLPSYR